MKQQQRRKQFLVNTGGKKSDKENGNPMHFIFFDTETNQKEEVKKIGHKEYTTTINSLQMGWSCYWNRETDEEEWFYFEEVSDFHKWCGKILTKTGKKVVWFIAHNINFDNVITDIWKLFKKRKFETDFIHAKGMVYLQKMTYRTINKVVDKKTGKEKERRNTHKTIMLVNNGNIFPAPLKKIGETINLPKLEVNFAEDSLEAIKIYCKRDVEILLYFWKQWTTFIEDNGLGKLKYTISSQSMEAFKTKFCKHPVLLDDDLENLSFERLAYYGGRTEIFYKGVVRQGIYYFDVNSMYPFVMSKYNYPTEYKFSKNKPSIKQVENLIDKGWLIIAECYINTKNNCYPYKEDNTLLFPTGKFKTYLATPEVIEALKNGDLEKFGRVSFYKGANLFAEYVNFFYNKRMELKEAGNSQEAMFKLFLNSLYGKFGQMMDSWIATTIEDIKNLDVHFDFDKWMMDEYKIPKIIMGGLDLTPNIRFIGEQLQMSGEKTESQISFPAIASHVTSYARLILWEVIKWCQENNVKYYYCDTDSIFTEKPIDKKFLSETILGKLKLEKYFKNGVEFINLKNYCALNEDGFKVVENEEGEKINIDGDVFHNESKVLKGKQWKMKGVSNNAIMLDEKTFIVQEWGGLPKQEYYKKFGRKAGEFWVIHKTKVNHDNINKGELLHTGDIKPFELEEF